MKDDSVYIDQILEAVKKIESFVSGFDQAGFLNDTKTQSAVIMQLAIIGELAKKISINKKESIPLPWKEIAGFRDMAIHNYFDIDLGVVWNTIITDLPELKKMLAS